MPDKPNRKEIETEWLQHGEFDLHSAKLLFQQKGHTHTVTMLLQQAAEKYLKGYLLSKGWKLVKTHDLELLISEAARYNKIFEQYLALARKLTVYYLEERYPPGPPVDYPREEIASLIAQVEKLVAKIKEAVK